MKIDEAWLKPVYLLSKEENQTMGMIFIRAFLLL
jgi:hypothetical protein